MTAQEQIAKLESLLDRIRRNVAKPRPVGARPAHAEPAAVPVSVAEEVSLESLGATESPAIAAEAPRERVQSADMEELEVVELGSEVVELSPAEAEIVSGAAPEPIDESVPESAPRPAVQSVEVELEPPVKTPPPESGRQAVTPPPAMAEPRAERDEEEFDKDDLLEADHSGGPISIATPGLPTMAQLGDTMHLTDSGHAPTKIDLAGPERVPARPSTDVLETDLSKRGGAAGAYDAALAPPSTASSDLERHREVKPESREGAPSRRVDPLAATVPDLRTSLSLAKTAPDTRSPFADAIRATTEATPEPRIEKKAEAPGAKAAAPPAPVPSAVATAPEVVVERPAIDAAHAAEVVVDKPRKVPETFLELLDVSLALHA